LLLADGLYTDDLDDDPSFIRVQARHSCFPIRVLHGLKFNGIPITDGAQMLFQACNDLQLLGCCPTTIDEGDESTADEFEDDVVRACALTHSMLMRVY
jgi:hypothetical protein